MLYFPRPLFLKNHYDPDSSGEESSPLCFAKKSIGMPKPYRNSLLLTIDNFIKATKLKAI